MFFTRFIKNFKKSLPSFFFLEEEESYNFVSDTNSLPKKAVFIEKNIPLPIKDTPQIEIESDTLKRYPLPYYEAALFKNSFEYHQKILEMYNELGVYIQNYGTQLNIVYYKLAEKSGAPLDSLNTDLEIGNSSSDFSGFVVKSDSSEESSELIDTDLSED